VDSEAVSMLQKNTKTSSDNKYHLIFMYNISLPYRLEMRFP